jgi:small-conductance mechanosensitive channel
MVILPSNSSCSSNGDEAGSNRSASNPINKPDTQYELIKQQRYIYEPQNISVISVYSKKLQQQTKEMIVKSRDDSDDGAYAVNEGIEETVDKNRELKEYISKIEEEVRPVNV